MLPFANLGGDPEQDYFCEGLAEEILNALTGIPGLRVMARTSSFSFRGKEQDIPQIGQALNLSPILRGGVRRSGTRFRITVQLIHAGNGYHLWSGTIEREANDAWAVQEQIARAIVAAIQLELTPEQRLTNVCRYAHPRLGCVRALPQSPGTPPNTCRKLHSAEPWRCFKARSPATRSIRCRLSDWLVAI